MSVLANIPIWVYFVVMAITFMVMHVLAYDPNRKTTRGAGATTAMRVGSSVILLIGLLVMQPADPVTLLLALALAAVGGHLSGRAAPPPRAREVEGTSQADGAGAARGDQGEGGPTSDGPPTEVERETAGDARAERPETPREPR